MQETQKKINTNGTENTKTFRKDDQICDMFNNISARYDFLNKILSFGIDCRWRKKLVRELKPYKPKQVLDVATGTGNLALRIAKIKPQTIIAVDVSEQMLRLGKEKIKKRKLDKLIKFKLASCDELPFDNESFDTVAIAFGVRNFEDPLKAMKEVYRVTENDGVVMILEFGIPKNPVVRIPFLIYFTKILPIIGGLLSGKKYAYSYLTTSVKKFPFGKDFVEILDKAGFVDTAFKKCTFGVTYLYIARKNSNYC